MANDVVPYFADAIQITAVAGTGGVTGMHFVTNSGPLAVGLGTDGGVPGVVIPAAAGAATMGVAAQDSAAGLAVGIFTRGTVPVVAGATLTGGTNVMTNTAGAAVPWTTGNQVAGYCVADAASGALAMITIAD